MRRIELSNAEKWLALRCGFVKKTNYRYDVKVGKSIREEHDRFPSRVRDLIDYRRRNGNYRKVKELCRSIKEVRFGSVKELLDFYYQNRDLITGSTSEHLRALAQAELEIEGKSDEEIGFMIVAEGL
jgi:hypothetical protein